MVNHEAVQGFVVNYFRSLEVGIAAPHNMILSQYYYEFLFF